MPQYVAVCRSCERSWSGRDVRFCGVCGDRLEGPAPRPDRPRRTRRAVAGTVAGAMILAGLAGLAAKVSGDRAVPDAGDPQVELGAGPVSPAGEPLSEAEAEALLQRVDPSRLRCEPRGCEVWHRDRQRPSGAATFGDLVVVLEGNRLTALEAETGDERWTAPIGHLRSVTSDGEEVRSTTSRAVIAANQTEDGVYLATGNEVSLIGADGNRVWSIQPERGIEWSMAVLDDHVVLHGPQRDGSAHRMVSLDPTTGETAWTALSTSVLVVESDVIMITTADRRLRALDPATGFTMWERSPRLGLWADSVGPWIVHHDDDGLALLDRSSGETVTTLPGYMTEPAVEVGGLWLVVLTASVEGQAVGRSPLVMIALEEDGEVAWQLPIGPDKTWDCCSILVSDEGHRVTLAGDGHVREIDATTGEVVGEPPAEHGAGTVWQAPDGAVLRWATPGELTVTTAQGLASVFADEVWVESVDPLVVGSADHVMGVRLLPPP